MDFELLCGFKLRPDSRRDEGAYVPRYPSCKPAASRLSGSLSSSIAISQRSLLIGIPEGGELTMSKLTKIGRSAVTGRFTKVSTAKAKPRTHVVETIKKK